MKRRFTSIPKSTFDDMQLDAGMLLDRFDPANPETPNDEDIICATTGGISINSTPTFSDFGEDVDNCPNNTKELKHLDGWEHTIGFTALNTTPKSIKLALGCADIDPETGAVKPRSTVSQSDFDDKWWVGDRADGGLVAVRLKNALSTGGLALTTTKNGKGQVAVTLTGHTSIEDPDEMAIEYYAIDPTGVSLDKNTASIDVEGTVTINATTVPDEQTVTWSSSDTDVATVSGGVVTGVSEGTATITATITVDGVDYSATCGVTVNAVG